MTCGANCCGVADVFDEAYARKELDKYRRHGPRGPTARLLSALRAIGQPFESLLDVGGGIGVIAHELLASGGVSRATIVEGSAASVAVAREESRRTATGDRLLVREGDLVELAGEVDASDVVTLDKVVCCYPDMDALLAVSAARARRLYGIVYPRDDWWVRIGIALENRYMRWKGSTFTGYVHSNAALDAALRRAGLVPRVRHSGGWWVVAVYERRSAGA